MTTAELAEFIAGVRAEVTAALTMLETVDPESLPATGTRGVRHRASGVAQAMTED